MGSLAYTCILYSHCIYILGLQLFFESIHLHVFLYFFTNTILQLFLKQTQLLFLYLITRCRSIHQVGLLGMKDYNQVSLIINPINAVCHLPDDMNYHQLWTGVCCLGDSMGFWI